ncbi:4-alpha-glucanotransferase [Rhizobium mesosinicum]|uniref:4-alpha-glucanotransferase n=1 Tax=Rhizobium mesosinicum TaxID=335017 RepID=A0ABS7GRZ1_9HYPH|nr:4-alpha-glucanotransferase [Rhizobium mesosinicum]MBW9052471.1 4-alpha-glucanotransferase [Rhizobium mesosinicum]
MKEAFRSLRRLARQKGIELVRPSPEGRLVRVSDRNLARMLTALGEDVAGISSDGEPRCHVPADLIGRPAWGLSLQLYELRSDRNWGIGDFKDLWGICSLAGALGADFIGLNPLHAGFLYEPNRCSPYEPSNRKFLNPLYIAVDEVEGFVTSPDIEAELSRLRELSLVDYEAVAAIKLRVLRTIWKSVEQVQNPALEEFIRTGGPDLRLHALFETLSCAQSTGGTGAGWLSWPREFQSPQNTVVHEFARAHDDEIEFHQWLQWIAHIQLSKAKSCCRRAKMRVGLYLDLAVGEALDGSATWSDRTSYVRAAAIGNPPEPFAAEGQDWRLAALRPERITHGDPSPFARLMTASMQYAGAVRIDHAAAFARLFLVPTDATPADGAYVRYPIDDMLEELANMSVRHQSIVIGEDLGDVAAGLREDLATVGALSYRILSYEQSEEGFVRPQDYPKLALACVSTHDHQTFSGWWKGSDIDLRLKHGLVSRAMTLQHRKTRKSERKNLLAAFAAAGVIGSDEQSGAENLEQLVAAAHEYIASTPCMLVSVRLADLTDEEAPTNIPGTDKTYSNWRPKLSVDLAALEHLPMVRRIANVMNRYRGNPAAHGKVDSILSARGL